MCLSIAMYVSVDCHIWAFCMPEQLPHMGHFCACSLPCVHLLIAISVPVDCLLWACCGPEQLPHMGHFCACRIPGIGLLIAIYVAVDFHMWASCLPHMRLLSVTCGPHVGLTTATCVPHVGQRCKTRVAHMCALSGSYFNCHMWALCSPLVECLLGEYLSNHFTRSDHRHSTRTSTSGSVNIPTLRTVQGQISFGYTGSKYFNSLPLNLKSIKEYTYFKRETKKHFSNLLCNEC